MTLRLSVPQVIADDLIGVGACLVPIDSRADPSTALTAVAAVGMAADVTSVLVAAPKIGAFARALVASVWRRAPRSREQEMTTLTLTITHAHGSSIDIDVSGLADERAAGLIELALTGAATPR